MENFFVETKQRHLYYHANEFNQHFVGKVRKTTEHLI